MEMQIMACVPTDRSGLPQDPALDNIIVTDLYTLRQCQNANCRQDIWVGPRQMVEYSKSPSEFWMLCFMCALAAVHQTVGRDFNPDTDVVELGGGYPQEGRPRIT